MGVSGPRGEYDALLLVSFGGPESMAEVLPFLQRVTAGRGIPDERLREVGRHYEALGGVSPINALNRALVADLKVDLAAHGLDLPVFWGNRNSEPFLADAVRAMRDEGVRRAACFLTSAFSSYSGCRQYRENLAAAQDAVAGDGGGVPALDVLRRPFDHPGFVDPVVDAVVAAYAEVGDPDARLVFTTHSVPLSAAESSGLGGDYLRQHRAVAEVVALGVKERTGSGGAWDLVFQSRSGPPSVPWLEPDVSDHLTALAEQGVTAVVLVPLGFVSDHMEVVWDLDHVAVEHARSLGLRVARAATAGSDPRFVAMVRELVLERVGLSAPRATTDLGPWPDRCPAGCCANPRGPLPAVGGADA